MGVTHTVSARNASHSDNDQNKAVATKSSAPGHPLLPERHASLGTSDDGQGSSGWHYWFIRSSQRSPATAAAAMDSALFSKRRSILELHLLALPLCVCDSRTGRKSPFT